MTKKAIILVLVILLVINTTFWLYVGIRLHKYIFMEKAWQNLRKKISVGDEEIEIF